eukprot:scaffold2700_cov123-Isochrysis_galbana.AAC.3
MHLWRAPRVPALRESRVKAPTRTRPAHSAYSAVRARPGASIPLDHDEAAETRTCSRVPARMDGEQGRKPRR